LVKARQPKKADANGIAEVLTDEEKTSVLTGTPISVTEPELNVTEPELNFTEPKLTMPEEEVTRLAAGDLTYIMNNEHDDPCRSIAAVMAAMVNADHREEGGSLSSAAGYRHTQGTRDAVPHHKHQDIMNAAAAEMNPLYVRQAG
jgi:hypothetical protein